MPSDLPNFSCESAAETVADEIVVNSRSETQRELLRKETRSDRAEELQPELRIPFSFEEKRPAISTSLDKPSMTGVWSLICAKIPTLVYRIQSLQFSPCNPIFAIQSLQFIPCNSVLAIQSLLCSPCNSVLAIQSLLCSLCNATQCLQFRRSLPFRRCSEILLLLGILYTQQLTLHSKR